MKILDTSAILRSDLDFSDGNYTMPQRVLDEIIGDERIAIDIAIENKCIKIINPAQRHVERVKKAAEKTGDISSLSGTDVDVIALALQKSCPVVTDDYAIQNVASSLGITYEKLSQDGIKRRIKWKKVCIGCGKSYDAEYEGNCSVCGSRVRRKGDSHNSATLLNKR